MDTNVFRDLAWGRLPEEAARLESLIESGGRPLFYTCDIVMRELWSRMSAKPNFFPKFREACKWMDRLCGNSGLSELSNDVFKKVLHEQPVMTPDMVRARVNQIRRRLLKAENLEDLDEGDRQFLDDVHGLQEAELAAWVKRSLGFQEGLLQCKYNPNASLDRDDRQLVVAGVTEHMR